MANITGAMPKPMHEKAKAGLQDIWMAETKKEATAAFYLFVETYGVKYERAVKKLIKDRDVLLTFYDFPAGIGNTSERQIQSKASSPRCATEPERQRGASAAKPPSPWSSS
jgi:transposase-like protein